MRRGYGRGRGRGYGGGGKILPTYFNCGEVGHVLQLCTKLHAPCGYYHNTEHVRYQCPNLLAKWEEKKGYCNMVTIEPRGDLELNKEDDVRVVTRGRIHKRMDLEKGEISCQNIEWKIKKVVQEPPKFDIMQQK
jgi:hypothetical protein